MSNESSMSQEFAASLSPVCAEFEERGWKVFFDRPDPALGEDRKPSIFVTAITPDGKTHYRAFEDGEHLPEQIGGFLRTRAERAGK
jgi:hypothetical protein